ncbi:hypothetical protein CLNEO_18390 [Anaerotignum neopropionicum]|uniref:Uncharacterized protein n=1 Tax=Anaerotignum neopropionicum TaxID=36847 RepID=A0A136WE70_9FIRM|nr:hypothetical protein [Anaerotignum neopropionicum]KXL52816.1 hypothetical protein CLNEO_18390 [Anaerotignum neopropionicum]
MKELDLCVRMTRTEFDEKNQTCKMFKIQDYSTYEVGQMVYMNGSHYIKTNGTTSCNFSMGEGWKTVVVTESVFTKGNQDFDANGQPYTATNPAPVEG